MTIFKTRWTLLALLVLALFGSWQCSFPPPGPWMLPLRTIQLPVRGATGQYLTPYLLEVPDTLAVAYPPQLQVIADPKQDTLLIRSMDDTPGNYLVSLHSGQRTATLAVRVTPRTPVTFKYFSETGAIHKVAVAGSFTDWRADQL
ncbi:MAG: hypothetical protein ACETWG_11825, partial [Candidatus Neomarinimicrobiota bacterium]